MSDVPFQILRRLEYFEHIAREQNEHKVEDKPDVQPSSDASTIQVDQPVKVDVSPVEVSTPQAESAPAPDAAPTPAPDTTASDAATASSDTSTKVRRKRGRPKADTSDTSNTSDASNAPDASDTSDDSANQPESSASAS